MLSLCRPTFLLCRSTLLLRTPHCFRTPRLLHSLRLLRETFLFCAPCLLCLPCLLGEAGLLLRQLRELLGPPLLLLLLPRQPPPAPRQRWLLQLLVLRSQFQRQVLVDLLVEEEEDRDLAIVPDLQVGGNLLNRIRQSMTRLPSSDVTGAHQSR